MARPPVCSEHSADDVSLLCPRVLDPVRMPESLNTRVPINALNLQRKCRWFWRVNAPIGLIGAKIAFLILSNHQLGGHDLKEPEAEIVKEVDTFTPSEEASVGASHTRAPAIVHYISRRKKHPAELDTSTIDPNAWLDS